MTFNLYCHHLKQTAWSIPWVLCSWNLCVYYLLTVGIYFIQHRVNVSPLGLWSIKWWQVTINDTYKWNWNFISLLSRCLSRIELLRHIRDFFQIIFKIEVQKPSEDERKGGDKVLMTCVGVGYTNINKTLK